ncbi:MAG: DUF6263 family protein [Ginsengibacter sp.]
MKKTATLLACILWFSISMAQNTASLNLKKGQKFSVETSSGGLITQEAMGQSTEIKFDVKSTNQVEVKNAQDTTYTVTNTITKMKTNMSFMGQEMTYDSEKKEDQDSEIGKNFGKIINHSNDVELSKSGKVISQKKGADSAIKKNEADADMMSGMMQNMVGGIDDGSSGLSQVFQPMPRKVKVGYSWMDSLSSEGSKSKTTYTIRELKGNEAIVSINRTLQLNNKAETQGMEVTNNSAGTVTGDAVVDISTGLVKHKTTTIETKGTVEAMGQEIPVTTRITSTTVVTPL